MYTLEALIPDCVGRYISDARDHVSLDGLISANCYAQCWKAYTRWITYQFDLVCSEPCLFLSLFLLALFCLSFLSL